MKRNISKIALVAMFAILGACSNNPGNGEGGGGTTTPTDAQIKAKLIQEINDTIATTSTLKDTTFTLKYYSDLIIEKNTTNLMAMYFTGTVDSPTKYIGIQISIDSEGQFKHDNIKAENLKDLTVQSGLTASASTIFYSDGSTAAFDNLKTALGVTELTTYKLYTLGDSTPFKLPLYIDIKNDKLTVVATKEYNTTGTKLSLEAKSDSELKGTIHKFTSATK